MAVKPTKDGMIEEPLSVEMWGLLHMSPPPRI